MASRVLFAISLSAANTNNTAKRLIPLLCAFSGNRVVLNWYDGSSPIVDDEERRCVTQQFRMRVHKGLFWKAALTPEVVRAYDYVWMVDADIQILEETVPKMLAFMRDSGAVLSQPRVRGRAPSAWSTEYPALRAVGPNATCNATTNVVEVMLPCFARRAWIAVYDNVLGKLSEHHLARSVFGMDLIWCPFLNWHYRASPVPACQVPAVDVVPPAVHHDERAIERARRVLGLNVRRAKYINIRLLSLPRKRLPEACL